MAEVTEGFETSEDDKDEAGCMQMQSACGSTLYCYFLKALFPVLYNPQEVRPQIIPYMTPIFKSPGARYTTPAAIPRIIDSTGARRIGRPSPFAISTNPTMTATIITSVISIFIYSSSPNYASLSS